MSLEQIIKYEGNNSTFIWKHPIEDFNTGSQLIVHESQEAVFFMNGQALDLFGAGRYTLETQNIPILGKAISIPTGGITPFHCEVYFINKTEQMAIRWGTDTRVQYIEPTYGFPLAIGANGEMSLSVDNSRKLIVKLVGTETSLTQEGLVRFFRGFLMTRIKTYIAQIMKADSINIFEIDSQLEQFSKALKERLKKDFLEYGIALQQFLVTSISKPDGDPQYEKFKELFFRQYADVADAKIKQQVGIIEQETTSKKLVIEAQGIAEKRKTEGYTYQQERGFDVAERIAENEGAGNFSSAGMGLGMMAGVSGVVGNAIGGVFHQSVDSINSLDSLQDSNSKRFCDNCGMEISNDAVFCDNCGYQLQENVCKKCGFHFARPGKFCPQCGNKRGG